MFVATRCDALVTLFWEPRCKLTFEHWTDCMPADLVSSSLLTANLANLVYGDTLKVFSIAFCDSLANERLAFSFESLVGLLK